VQIFGPRFFDALSSADDPTLDNAGKRSLLPLIDQIMQTEPVLRSLYPNGQEHDESFLAIQRQKPEDINPDERAGIAYRFNVSLFANSYMSGIQFGPEAYFSSEEDPKFKQAIEKHTDHYVECIGLRYQQMHETQTFGRQADREAERLGLTDSLCLIICHPTYREAVFSCVRESILIPQEVRWQADGTLQISH
jgi:hypothetical protein